MREIHVDRQYRAGRYRAGRYRDGRCRAGTVMLFTLAMLLGTAHAASSADWAVVVMYHRFGESDHSATNISLVQFEAHLSELQTGGYTVLALPEIVAAIRDGRELPDKSVAITIDDAYLSLYEEAWPRRREAGFPFTVFVATDPVDQRFPDFMNWDQLRELQRAGVTIGGHTASHLRMAAQTEQRVADDIAAARARFAAELGGVPALFSYPFGEAGAAVRQVVVGAGYEAAFGQHSGAMHRSADPFYLPRFPLSEAFGGIDRFRLVASALPIPITDLTPSDPLLQNNPPLFGFTLTEEIERRNGLSCFASGQGRVQLEWLGPRAEVRLPEPFPPGRARINCTVPAGEGRWRWLGMQYYVAG